MTNHKWKIISYIIAILFIFQMGYIFTGRILHEIIGLCAFIAIGFHVYQKRQYYKNFKRLSLPVQIVLVLLSIDLIVLVLSAFNVSTVLFPFIHLGLFGRDIHQYSAILACVFIVFHIGLSIERQSKKKKKVRIIMIALACLTLVGSLMGLPYLNRHFKIVNVNLSQAIQGEKVDFSDYRVLTVYFTRVGNSDFEDDVDAVSGASLMLDQENHLIGNTQLLAYMIQDSINCDIKAIETVEKYPSSYSETTKVAYDELQSDIYPELSQNINIDGYDIIILVYPLWWGTIPNAVATFLKDVNWSDQQVIVPLATQGSSGFGSSVDDIRQLCPNVKVLDGELSIYCDDIPFVREDITEWLKNIMSQL